MREGSKRRLEATRNALRAIKTLSAFSYRKRTKHGVEGLTMAQIEKPKHACMMNDEIMLLFFDKMNAVRFVRKMRIKGYNVHYKKLELKRAND